MSHNVWRGGKWVYASEEYRGERTPPSSSSPLDDYNGDMISCVGGDVSVPKSGDWGVEVIPESSYSWCLVFALCFPPGAILNAVESVGAIG